MKYSKTILMIFALMITLGISSCSKSDNTQAPSTTGNEDASYNFVISVPDVSVPSDYTDATLETSANIAPPPPNTGATNTAAMDPGTMIARALRDLKLTPEQVAQVKRLMAAREDCVRKLMLRLRQSEKAIMDKAELARREVMKALKNGDITREQAAARLKLINETARKALMENPARLEVMKALVGCEDAFLDAVGGLLTPEQKAKWDAFVAKYREMRDKKRPNVGTRG